jgi:sugar-phosphatase
MASAPQPLAEPFSGVLLDMDGTLIDSISAVERSWLRWCAEYGVDPERLRGRHGVTANALVAELLPRHLRAEGHQRIVELEVDDVDGITVLPGAAELLSELDGGAVPTAIVTSSSAPLAEARLRATGLPHPSVVVTASDVERGKPWPDPWLEAARRLGIEPSGCLVVEDSVAGLRAGRRAGARGLVAVLGTTPREDLEAVADLVVEDIAHLPVEVSGRLARLHGWA